MTYEEFIKDYSVKGMLKRQECSFSAIEKLVLRSGKDLAAAKANLIIDEGIAYTVAYLAMMRTGRAFMLMKGFRPTDGFQHKTVVEFMGYFLRAEYSDILEHFDRMRRKRNIFTYDIDISVSATEAKNAINTAVEFVDLIKDIIKKENPQNEFKF